MTSTACPCRLFATGRGAWLTRPLFARRGRSPPFLPLARHYFARRAASKTPSARRQPAIWRISRNHSASTTTSQQSYLLLIELNRKVTGTKRDEFFHGASKRNRCRRLPSVARHTSDTPEAYGEAAARAAERPRIKHRARIQEAARAYAQDGNGPGWSNDPATRLRVGKRGRSQNRRKAEQADRDGTAHGTPRPTGGSLLLDS